MAERGSASEESAKDRLQKALVGYETAVHLWTYQGEQWWARFNIMLLANSMVVAAVTVVLTSSPSDTVWTLLLRVLSVALPLGGVALALFWLALISRENVYADYYVWSARELEEQHLHDTVKTVWRGRELAEGKTVQIVTDGSPRPLRMAGLARCRGRNVARAAFIFSWL